MRSRQAHLSILASALLWASAGPACALLPAATGSAAVAAGRLLVGAVALALHAGPRRFAVALPMLPRVPLAAAAVAMALYQWSFIAAVSRAGVAASAFVAAVAAPFFAGAFAALARGAHPGPRWAVAAAVGAAGLCALDASRAGLALALASGAAYALYTLASARLGQGHGLAEPATAVALLAAGLALLPAAAGGFGGLPTARTLAITAWLGLGCTALAYRLFAVGLRAVAAGRALALLVAEPIAASLLAVLLGERARGAGIPGFVLLVLAALLLRGPNHSDLAQPMKGKQPCPPLPAVPSSSSTCRTNTSPETC